MTPDTVREHLDLGGERLDRRPHPTRVRAGTQVPGSASHGAPFAGPFHHLLQAELPGIANGDALLRLVAVGGRVQIPACDPDRLQAFAGGAVEIDAVRLAVDLDRNTSTAGMPAGLENLAQRKVAATREDVINGKAPRRPPAGIKRCCGSSLQAILTDGRNQIELLLRAARIQCQQDHQLDRA